MTKESYYMTLEPYGFKLSFKDPAFKTVWDQIEESQDALHEVEQKISAELLSRNLSPQIDINRVEPNGSKRKTVYYERDAKKKRMHFSQKDGQWMIDYFAGRPIPESYISSIKKWIISILPSFK